MGIAPFALKACNKVSLVVNIPLTLKDGFVHLPQTLSQHRRTIFHG